jgi:drug/metabolite transporter (DMT)-like permease
MTLDPWRAAIFYLISVLLFASASTVTAWLVPNFSVFLIMGLRTLVGSAVLLLIALLFRSTLDFSFLLTGQFWAWSGVFILALLFYGIAFTTQALEGVFLVVATMPIVVIVIEMFLNRSALPRTLFFPIGVMFGAAFLGSMHSFYLAKNSAPLYVWTAAVTATLLHAVWVVWGGRLPSPAPAARACVMFAAAGSCLSFASSLSFFHYATEDDWQYLLAAGVLSAFTVFMVIHALRRDRASYVIPYHYTFGIWGLIFGLPKRTEWGLSELMVPATAAFIIGASSIWLYRRRLTI